jgi:serine/threonine protein kinase
MEQSVDQDQRVMDLVAEALSRLPEERDAFLRNACRDDDELYREVSEFVFWEVKMGDFLLRPIKIGFEEGPKPFLAGQIIEERFEIKREIGEGGMGVVYEAFDKKRQTRVAIKAAKPGFQRWLLPELEGALSVRHPNVCRVNEIHTAHTEHGEIDFLTMELLEGETLADILRERGKLSEKEALPVARQLCGGISEAHRCGVIHRDLKPSNVILCRDRGTEPRVVITDFGLAGAAAEPGELAGTPEYMAPELWEGIKTSKASDVYALGVILSEIVCPPDSDGRRRQTKGLSHRWRRTIDRCLADSPDARPRDAANLIAALEPPDPPPARRVFAVVLPLMALTVGAGYFFNRRSPELHLDNMVPITNSGNVALGAISPDGNSVALATRDDDDRQTLKVSRIGSGMELERIPPRPGEYSGITFAPDGRSLYVVHTISSFGKLYLVPLSEGDPKLLVDDVDSPVDFSPDRRSLVFIRRSAARRQASLVIRSQESGSERVLKTIKYPENFTPAPVWFPDGHAILCGLFSASLEGRPDLMFVALDARNGNYKRTLGPLPWNRMDKPVWTPDGHALILSAEDLDSNRNHLAQVSWPDGQITTISHGTDNYQGASFSTDGKALVTLAIHPERNLWIAPFSDPDQLKLLTYGRYFGLSWSKTGELISQTDVGGQPGLWAIDSTTGQRRPITSDPFMQSHAEVSSDGRFVVYATNRKGTHIWRQRLDGTEAVQLTSGASRDSFPAISPDGKTVVYGSTAAGQGALWKVSIDGGKPAQLTDERAEQPEFSPDGRWIACNYWLSSSRRWSAAILRANTGQPVHYFAGLPGDGVLRWTPDSQNLVFIKTTRDGSNLWRQPINGGAPSPLTHFHEDTLYSAAASPGGNRLALIRGHETSDLVIARTSRH